MIRFLIRRPVAVIMAFTAFFILGVVTYFTLPVSLLPDIPIPEMVVQVNGNNMSARELESTVVNPVRQRLMQISVLRDIESEVRDESGLIRLRFDYGVNTNLAFIEVNEKIDAAMNSLPRGVSRPRVIKASATDIPVFNLHLTLHADSSFKEGDEARFLDLSEFAVSVLKRRLEQLPSVAMADITGYVDKQVRIIPDLKMLDMTGISLSDIETALSNNNVEAGSMTVRDGHYEYNIKFSTLLRTPEDIENVYITSEDRIYQIRDIARVEVTSRKERGFSLYNGKRAVTLALIKQSQENMDTMKEAVQEVIDYFEKIHPDIEFSVSQNQTELLDYTISNLQENLLMGFILICIVSFMFLGDKRSPIVISASMIVSLVISLLFFFLFGISLNIISISGLILALGMMIDSSIIVTDNIAQYREQGGAEELDDACVRGTNEVILPILSSSLTTIAVFVPLVFMSGIAGALFKDEAFSVSIGLGVSYLVAIFLLPVIYRLLYRVQYKKNGKQEKKNQIPYYVLWYDKGIDFVFGKKLLFTLIIIAFFPLCVLLFYVIKKEKIPQIEQTELILFIDWNENIHLAENKARTGSAIQSLKTPLEENSCYISRQDYLLNRSDVQSQTEAEVYMRVAEGNMLEEVKEEIAGFLRTEYPLAVFSFSPPQTVFEKVFSGSDAELVIRLEALDKSVQPSADSIRFIRNRLNELTGIDLGEIAFNDQINISIDRERLMLYSVSESAIRQTLKTAFHENEFALLRSYRQYLPIVMSGKETTINDVLTNATVQIGQGKEAQAVPLSSFIKVSRSEDLKHIIAGRDGEYIPLEAIKVDNPEKVMKIIEKEMENHANWEVSFTGGYFDNKEMFNELLIVLLVSLLMMYFILAAQFESLTQPLIVLLEIPIDVAAALLILWLSGHTLNLMSAIGIVVTCGIVINDSILKIDVINTLRKSGVPLMEAIHTSGHKRLRAIIMTSLTTILAMLPLLFSSDMGSELQKPLAIAMIGSMVIGTLVSVFVIPLAYWAIYRKKS